MFFRYISGNQLKHCLQKSTSILNQYKTPIINFSVETNYPTHLINQEFQNISKHVQPYSRIALKLSLFDFDIDKVKPIIENLISKKCQLLIDAENENNYENYRNLTNEILFLYNKDRVNIFKTYQMYRTDSLDELENDIIENKKNNHHLGVKLVRGAYYQEDKNKKRLNNINVLFQNKKDTDLNYNQGILNLYNQPLNKSIIVASHNQESINLTYLLNKEKKIFEFAHLMGMNENKYNDLLKKGEKVNVYVPYGPYKYMIPYLSRRLYENIDTLKYMI